MTLRRRRRQARTQGALVLAAGEAYGCDRGHSLAALQRGSGGSRLRSETSFLERLVVARQGLADPLGERLGGHARLLALSPQLLDGHVARRVDLCARDDPRRPVLVPYPDVLHPDLEVRIAR